MQTFEYLVTGRAMVAADSMEAGKAILEAGLEEVLLTIDSIEEV